MPVTGGGGGWPLCWPLVSSKISTCASASCFFLFLGKPSLAFRCPILCTVVCCGGTAGVVLRCVVQLVQEHTVPRVRQTSRLPGTLPQVHDTAAAARRVRVGGSWVLPPPPPPTHASFVDVQFIAYNKNPDNKNNNAPGTHRLRICPWQ